MPLRFTITESDPVNFDSSVAPAIYATAIAEPVGLDSINLHLKRDNTYHGFFDAVDDSLGALRFYGDAYHILKYAYMQYGLEANVMLKIEYACSDTDAYSLLYLGRFSFDKYKDIQGIEGCYIEAGIENGQDLMLFRNRMDTKVSLDGVRPLDDGYADLTTYGGLAQQITLKPMTMRLINEAVIDSSPTGSQVYTYLGGPSFTDQENDDADSTQHNEFKYSTDNVCAVVTPFTTVKSQELGTFTGGVGDEYLRNGMPGSGMLTASGLDVTDLSDPTEIFHFNPDIEFESNDIHIDIELSGAVFAGNHKFSSDDVGISPLVNIAIYKGVDWEDVRHHGNIFYDFSNPGNGYKPGSSSVYTNVSGCIVDFVTAQEPTGGRLFDGHAIGIDNHAHSGTINYAQFQYSFHKTVRFKPDEKLWFFVQVTKSADGHGVSTPQFAFFSNSYTYRNTYPAAAQDAGIIQTLTATVTADAAHPLSYIKLSFDSKFQESKCNAYMVNEALSRTTELVTNDALRVYSDYFGRTDAQPYSSSADGAGALECITTGLLIRDYSILAALQMTSEGISVSTPGGSSYRLAATDTSSSSAFNIIEMSSTGTITVPTDTIYSAAGHSPVAFHTGDQVIIQQGGAGVVTVTGEALTGGGHVNVFSPTGSYSSYGPGSQLLLTKIGDDDWLLSSHTTMSVSFKELFEALHTVHAVGFGDEDDMHRSTYADGTHHKLIRVEPISYFYDHSTVMMTCENVDIVETAVDAGNMLNLFRTGYQKWEAEEAQGLDEFLSKRSFRTTLSHIRSAWDKVCKFVASGYAIEATRRKLGTNTTDWRFDNDNFLICLRRSSGSYVIEQGIAGNGTWHSEGMVMVPNPASGMISPGTAYNYRISPVRNALRWLRYIICSYADWTRGKLIFESGDGNYHAAGVNLSSPIEGRLLSECDTLSMADYHGNFDTHGSTTADYAVKPIYRNELVKFKYPLSYTQWLSIFNTKYGLIKYSVNSGDYQYGYVQELKYNLFEGLGEFTLKPVA